MSTTNKIMAIMLVVIVVTLSAIFLIGATFPNQEQVKDMVVGVVVKNVNDHPTIDAIVKKVPGDCLLCHSEKRTSAH